MNSGWVILDKPSGMTSRAAGGKVARMFGVKKFGHLGTLDPMASGVLPIALGEATKMIPYIDAVEGIRNKEQGISEKEYEFYTEWGFETDTLDITGKVIKQDGRLPDYKEIDTLCDNYRGEIEQTPPAYSAIHVNGRRAYELARKGVAVEIPPRKIKIYDLILGNAQTDSAGKMASGGFLVRCSAGTYVRSLARDIGQLAGGYLCTVTSIRRTRTHEFRLKDEEHPENNAVSLDFLENLYHNDPNSVLEYLKPVDFGLDDILVAELNDEDAALFQHGGVLITKDDSVGLRRVYHDGHLIGIGRNDNYVLMPQRIINN